MHDYANHYVENEITGCEAQNSESIAGRGIARLISWLDTAGQLTTLIEYLIVILEYIDLFGSYSQHLVGPGHYQDYLWLHRHSTNLQDFRSLLG